jgi:outer membrane cobalamin receptor
MRVATSTLAVSASLGCAGLVSAQDTGSQSAASAPVQEITVTGSRIASPDATSISPISTVSGAELSQRGITRIEDLINTLPQVCRPGR